MCKYSIDLFILQILQKKLLYNLTCSVSFKFHFLIRHSFYIYNYNFVIYTCDLTNARLSHSNWTEWSTIQRVIAKSDERKARGRFEITSTITP